MRNPLRAIYTSAYLPWRKPGALLLPVGLGAYEVTRRADQGACEATRHPGRPALPADTRAGRGFAHR